MLHVNYELCTGCGACKNACPVDCIALSEDDDGFLFPSVNLSSCIHCGSCVAACPLDLKKSGEVSLPSAYAVVSEDVQLLMRSTSGGAFGAIAQYVFSRNGVVFGCAYTKDLSAKHIRVDSIQSLSLLHGSKYVQSDTGDTFKQAKEDLDSNRLVLYSGTPCQIAGLKCFLGKEYDNLITADIVCHGVPSRAFFRKYVQWYETRNKVHLTNIDFRSKKTKGWSCSGICEGIKENASHYSANLSPGNSYFYHYFLSGSIYRNSCYSCPYANTHREGDFTLGDLWGAEGLNLPFRTDKGCSLLLLNTRKAAKIFAELNCLSKEVPLDYIVKHNAQLRTPSAFSVERNKILYRHRFWNPQKIHRAFVRENFKIIAVRRIKQFIPRQIKTSLLKLIYQNR